MDDRLAQVESVNAALTELGIPVVAFWYRFTAIHQKGFNPIAANIQLADLLFCNKYTEDEQAEKSAKNFDEISPENDLNRIINKFGRHKFKPEDFY